MKKEIAMPIGSCKATTAFLDTLRVMETRLQHPCCLWVNERNGFSKAILTESLADICPGHSTPTNLLDIMPRQTQILQIPTLEDGASALQIHYASLAAASYRFVQRSFLLNGKTLVFMLETYYTSQYEIRNQDEHTNTLQAQERNLRSMQQRWRKRARRPRAPSGMERTLSGELQALLGPSLLAIAGYTVSVFLFEPTGAFTVIYQPQCLQDNDNLNISKIARDCHARNRPLKTKDQTATMAAVIPSNKRTSIVVVLKANDDKSSQSITIDQFLSILHPQKREVSKLLEKQMRRQEQNISSHFIEDSPDPIIAVNQHGTVLIFNHAAEKLFQYKKGDIIGTYVAHLYESEKEARRVGRGLADAPKSSLENIEVRVKAKDGTVIPISLSAKQYYDSQNMKTGSFSVFKDIRSLKKPYEEEARTKYFSNLVLNSPDPTVVIDKSGEIRIFNTAAADLFGYRPEQVIGQPITMLYAGEEEAKRIGYLLNKAGDQRVQNLETQTVNQQGDVIPVSLSARVLKDERNNISGSFGVFKDLREIRRAEKSEVFTRLARTTGHELKNHLQAALMNIDAMTSSNIPPEVTEIVLNLEKNICEAIEHVQNLLLSSRPDAPRVAWVSAESILREIRRRFEGAAHSRGISFCATLKGDDGDVLVDARQIYQIISNLFVNSIDAIAEKASQADSSFKGSIEVTIECSRSRFVIEWMDNGIGISRGDRAKIFELFFTNKGSYSGNGIGLFISKKIAENHGGSIEVDSIKGHYARFLVTLPKAGSGSPQNTPAAIIEE